MEQQLKQRLVGVAVIFSLAIIFLPMLLDGSGNKPQQLEVSIPVPPEIPAYEIVEHKVTELKSRVENIPAQNSYLVDENSDPVIIEADSRKTGTSAEKDKGTISRKLQNIDSPPVIKKDSIPSTAVKPVVKKDKKSEKKQPGGKSWVIQVGSFSEKSKAFKQRDKLRKSGLSAVFIENFKFNGKLSYRVRMGPFLSRNKAKVVGNKIRAKYNIKGLLMTYEK